VAGLAAGAAGENARQPGNKVTPHLVLIDIAEVSTASPKTPMARESRRPPAPPAIARRAAAGPFPCGQNNGLRRWHTSPPAGRAGG
jgi:hypothetical protein